MSDYSSVILGKAFSTGLGADYNQTSFALRQENDWIFYEVVLAQGQPWAKVREQIFPPLGRFLGFKKLAKSFGSGMVISVFYGGHFYLITGPDFLGAYCELEHLAPEALPAQLNRWIADETLVLPLLPG